ncbi:Homeobox protein yox1 [Ascochyta rabiei]|uniref:Sequence-specific DNA binding n=1 Tax=Didymella rabiei TaxID=5454 RepID=A0A163BWA8_DIDRA|nr:Homeobox protein yox1 [Ascochyta rabiei]KZM22048.1 sequence-specific DNA binding [Ascochyta rabiei]UPX17503.1 Homeobox protein yox1 [Ascochyta rabiei]
MPPDVDNKPLARQKRRRTSKEDEDILKAEYLINSKPDKAARLEIVRKVALGEKEVQIWFQNKRQNDRRRSRPLEPSSSASLMSSSSNMSDPATEDEHARDGGSAPEPETEAPKTDAPERATTPEAASNETALKTQAVGEATAVIENDTPTTTQPTVEPSPAAQTVDTAPAEISNSQQSASASQGAQPRTSWISNRRSASFVRSAEDYAPETITFPNAPLKAIESPEVSRSVDTRPLKRTHSFVRIATNEGGTARVVTDLDKTPSPPHSRTTPVSFARAAAGLRRSYSAAGLNDRLLAAARGEPSPKMARVSPNIGRSRDSRAWEFWCDPDTRHNTSLTARAEQEGSGSAADAIGLLRANRRILAQNQARQNTPLKSRQSSHKMLGSSGVKKSRGSIQRASTFNVFSSGKKPKDSEETESDEFPSTESDKENWEPDMPKSVRRRPFATPGSATRPRRVLGENTNVISQSASLGALLAKAKSKSSKGTVDPEQDEELRTFMNGDSGSARTNLSSAEEAGCVEGLLALSQGQWR